MRLSLLSSTECGLVERQVAVGAAVIVGVPVVYRALPPTASTCGVVACRHVRVAFGARGRAKQRDPITPLQAERHWTQAALDAQHALGPHRVGPMRSYQSLQR